MELFRVFSWSRKAKPDEPGGALYAPRGRQGSGRHDNPDLYTAFYCAREPVSCVAESLQFFRSQRLTAIDLIRSSNRVLALVSLKLDPRLVDLDAPSQLVEREIRPSQVATTRRRTTQRIAADLYREGVGGFLWWSTLEASWINCTLFWERVTHQISVEQKPQELRLDNPTVVAAAQRLGVQLRH